MNGYEVCAAVLMLGALLPAVALAAVGRSADRLIGVVLTSSVVTVIMLLVAQISGQSYELIVPLVLVLLSVVGTLVFTRLISGAQDET
ncbi:MAG TPA: monovalent cation/H+ antiporter complex subunit F [Acidimicrobiales bacterium]|nr:monovalent cation/H+ antiporter complex subunit F [Acidimicrobiales bacterium]